MTEPAFDLLAAHRWFAVEANNESWDLIEQQSRTSEEDVRMLAAAYSSLRHWSAAGTPLNEQRAHHLITRVLTELGQAELARRHADLCFRLAGANAAPQTPLDRACAYEALARAQACAGQIGDARRLRHLAETEGRKIEPPEREFFEGMLCSGRWYGCDCDQPDLR